MITQGGLIIRKYLVILRKILSTIRIQIRIRVCPDGVGLWRYPEADNLVLLSRQYICSETDYCHSYNNCKE